MRSTIPTLLLLALLTVPFAAPAASTVPKAGPGVAQEVGIDEKLGQTIALDQPLRDEQGRPITLRSLLVKPTVLTLNYFRCAGICTPQLQGVVDLLNRTHAEPGKAFQVVTVSFDPRDTPEIAAQKRTNYLATVTRSTPMPASAWRFLTGDAAATKAVTDSVGFKFKPQKDDFIHPAALIMLSPKGEVTRYLYGITYLPADLEMAVQEASMGQPRPTINRLLDICFSYDPDGRKVAFRATRIAASLVLLGVAIFVLTLVRKGRKRNRPTKEDA